MQIPEKEGGRHHSSAWKMAGSASLMIRHAAPIPLICVIDGWISDVDDPAGRSEMVQATPKLCGGSAKIVKRDSAARGGKS
jgi:hypothetical protein